ncbi:MAG: sigma-54 dependent transcriptional regulator [Deltaproteobacteria bacterium]|jgi:two-component system NtrC family response regulator|nr:sigma-54 dependent transcriptional regulator [Deltaproteobacteria bacterium]
MHTILVVDDEEKLREVLSAALESMGYSCVTAGSAEEALQVLQDKEHEVHLILSDLRMPGLGGRDLLQKVQALAPELPVVIMTAYAAVQDAVAIIKEGAFDYLVKPFELGVLDATVASALRFRALSADNRQLRQELGRTFGSENFIGQSPAIRMVRQNISEVSASFANVLITGESGTGKEVVAKGIHYSGPRASAPFVTINCAAIPEALLESELFGHVKGAFTGAIATRPGRFTQADKGTLFLDEIGDMPLALQAKILRCIEAKTVEPVGSRTSLKVDVRIIAATNQDLAEAIGRGAFRRDLYYRLNVYPIALPPLRERREDIPLLTEHFSQKCAAKMGRSPVTFTAEARKIMQDYHWPGNIRELENCVERLSIIAPGGRITPEKLAACSICGDARELGPLPASPAFSPGAEAGRSALPLALDHRLEELERELIMQALAKSEGVQVKAAELLHITERSIWHRIKKLGITVMHKRTG